MSLFHVFRRVLFSRLRVFFFFFFFLFGKNYLLRKKHMFKRNHTPIDVFVRVWLNSKMRNIKIEKLSFQFFFFFFCNQNNNADWIRIVFFLICESCTNRHCCYLGYRISATLGIDLPFFSFFFFSFCTYKPVVR